MAFFVKFWGTRGSIPTPGFRTRTYGGNTSCVELRIDDVLMICDAGSGIRELGLDLMNRVQGPLTGHLFFSHTHWDHIQGFPFFTPAYEPENTFYVYGTQTGDTRVHDLLSGQMKSQYFPIDFSDLGSNILARNLGDGSQDIEGVRVRCHQLDHPGGCFAYSFEKASRKVVYATDTEIDRILENQEEAGKDSNLLRSVPRSLVEFIEGADLLILDGQYTDEEYLEKAGWGHSRVTTAVDLAVQAQAQQLAIFHHDPLQNDNDVKRKIEQGRKRAARLAPDLIVFGAREGVELRIDREDDQKG
jgi:phosphoribosyl 1,2-cyclic phosphodiesterase